MLIWRLSIQLLTGLGLGVLLLACEPALVREAPHPLDQAEIITPTGWRLRIYGDGSATLTHRQYPTHHLDYPTESFYPVPARRVISRCFGNATDPLCSRLTYYSAARDETVRCGCAVAGWVDATLNAALNGMQSAVDDPGSERSCRTLYREWLASR